VPLFRQNANGPLAVSRSDAQHLEGRFIISNDRNVVSHDHYSCNRRSGPHPASNVLPELEIHPNKII
jgi:hypothetical protein